MTNFDELFAQANEVADKRRACFNQLIEKTISDILPKFCETMKRLELKQCFFRSSNMINTYQEVQRDEDDDEFYCICINQDETFNDARLNEYENRYYIPESWKDQKFANDSNHFTRAGIVEFVKLLNSRLTDIVKKYKARVEEGENLLKQ